MKTRVKSRAATKMVASIKVTVTQTKTTLLRPSLMVLGDIEAQAHRLVTAICLRRTGRRGVVRSTWARSGSVPDCQSNWPNNAM